MKPVALFVALACSLPVASTQDLDRPSFQIVSIKRTSPEKDGRGLTRLRPAGGFEATNVALRELIAFAYQRHVFDQREVVDGPEWIDSERFDVVATAAGDHIVDPDGTPRQTLMMLRTLLAERFKVRAREEDRELPVYMLTTAAEHGALGPKMRESEIDCGAVMKGPPPAAQPGQGPPCSMKTPPGRLFANTFTMPAIASLLSRHLDRPVIDATRLSGRFDIELEAAEIKAPPDYKPGPSDLALAPANGPSIFVAVQEQLGLRLEPRVAPVAVVVVDHAERPIPK